ncbi:hypothetical protein WME95_12190 [Sorangium sp. So ce327]|uniref:hypothetical protein n=1 Tax=Sorangium sp. So ce327 TaxID=3133301 RepID=UPI003F5E22E6
MKTNLKIESLRRGPRSVLALLLVAAVPACAAAPAEEPMVEDPADESVDASEEALRSGDAAGWAFYNGSGLVPVRSFNSSGGATRVVSSGVGVYTATFDGLSGSGGNVQVNAAGGDGQRCKVASWGTAGAALQVNIRCHAAAGQAANSPFIVSYARFAGGTAVSSDGAYVWVDRPSTDVFTPSPTYQWGAPSTVNRTRTGRYIVTLAGQASDGGSMLVTAYGTGAEYCKTAEWQRVGTDTDVEVRCFGPGGAPADSRFSLRYIRDVRDAATESGGFVWAHDPTAASYTPSLTFQHHRITSECNDITEILTAQRLSTGRYLIKYPEMGSGTAVPSGAALATAYGTGPEYCNVTGWSTPASDPDLLDVGVRCFNASGSLVDTQFTQTYFANLFHAC